MRVRVSERDEVPPCVRVLCVVFTCTVPKYNIIHAHTWQVSRWGLHETGGKCYPATFLGVHHDGRPTPALRPRGERGDIPYLSAGTKWHSHTRSRVRGASQPPCLTEHVTCAPRLFSRPLVPRPSLLLLLCAPARENVHVLCMFPFAQSCPRVASAGV